MESPPEGRGSRSEREIRPRDFLSSVFDLSLSVFFLLMDLRSMEEAEVEFEEGLGGKENVCSS